MEEKYFIIDVKNRECGAFTEAELNDIGLFEDSLIFCADWNERKPLNQIPELSHIKRKPESIKPYNSNYGKKIIPKHPLSKPINEEMFNKYSIKCKKTRILVFTWMMFHLWAYFFKQIAYSTSSERLYFRFYSSNVDIRKIVWPFYCVYDNGVNLKFELFRGYDLTEFIGYNFAFIFIWFILYTKNQKS